MSLMEINIRYNQGQEASRDGLGGICPRRRVVMRTTRKPIWAVLLSSAVLLAITVGVRIVHGQAQHVRWDIVSVEFNTPSPGVNTINSGGVAYANARNPNTLKIKLTGSGTFVAPASGASTG